MPTTIFNSLSYRDYCTDCLLLKTEWTADYLNIFREIDTGEMLTDDSILDLVAETRPANQMSDNDEDDEPEEPTVKKIDARKGLAQVISCCEQNPTLSTHLDDLWKVMRAMDTYSGCYVQKTLFDFLKK